MEDNEDYQKRYFDTRLGEVALTCCTRCGAIVWNPELHERAEHGNEGTIVHNHEGTGEVSTGEDDGDEVENLSDTGGSAVGVSGGASIPRPVSSPPARGTGRTTAAGSGKQARR